MSEIGLNLLLFFKVYFKRAVYALLKYFKHQSKIELNVSER